MPTKWFPPWETDSEWWFALSAFIPAILVFLLLLVTNA